MRLKHTGELQPNDCLAKPIYNDNGQVLIHEGVPLTKNVIQRLRDIGITYVYIEDELSKDVEIEEAITEKTRKKAITTIKDEFSQIAKEMNNTNTFNGDHLSQNFSNVVQSVLEDVQSNEQAISLLSDAYIYDSYIFTHSLNVTIYTLALATELNYSEKKLMEIGLGAILHDVGKMVIPAEILNKPGRLTDEEFHIMKTHAEKGYRLLKDLPNISLLTAHCAYQHHERVNGSGYPRGISGNDIHEYAKVIGIADVFDAVTSNRVYRNAMLPHEGLEILYGGAGTLFDKEMVHVFSQTVAIYPVGLTVELSGNRKGIVIQQNKGFTSRPVVRVYEENGVPLEKTYEIDMMKEMNVTITHCETPLGNRSSQ